MTDQRALERERSAPKPSRRREWHRSGSERAKGCRGGLGCRGVNGGGTLSGAARTGRRRCMALLERRCARWTTMEQSCKAVDKTEGRLGEKNANWNERNRQGQEERGDSQSLLFGRWGVKRGHGGRTIEYERKVSESRAGGLRLGRKQSRQKRGVLQRRGGGRQDVGEELRSQGDLERESRRQKRERGTMMAGASWRRRAADLQRCVRAFSRRGRSRGACKARLGPLSEPP